MAPFFQIERDALLAREMRECRGNMLLRRILYSLVRSVGVMEIFRIGPLYIDVIYFYIANFTQILHPRRRISKVMADVNVQWWSLVTMVITLRNSVGKL
jgi:hypothetical protein